MAFRPPTVAPSRPAQTPAGPPLQIQSTIRQQDYAAESHEWVIFSPSQDAASSTRTHTISSDRTPRTAGLSRISDFGSLRTSARSGYLADEISPNEEDGELDSLDEGLHAFREPSLNRLSTYRADQDQGTVLPAHDGLGSFQASSAPVQEQLWQHEQYNPKRKFEGHHRRRSSVQRRLDTIGEDEDHGIDEEKRIRIENWRLDQSKALLDEIERETRRMNRRQSFKDKEKVRDFQMGATPTQGSIVASEDQAEEQESSEPFWRKMTRRFIRDFIGIDESLLSVIFGESLPEEAFDNSCGPSRHATDAEQSTASLEVARNDSNWRDKLLQRIARELGILVDQLSVHPGAFSAYFKPVSAPPLEYAGIPIKEPKHAPLSPRPHMDSKGHIPDITSTAALSPKFQPTLQTQTRPPPSQDATSWGLDEDPATSPLSRQQTSTTISAADSERARKYWEQDLDLKMVFGYLKGRFSSPHQPPHPSTYSSSNTHDPARRAAIIRQHHPLISRSQQHASTTTNRLSVSRLNSFHALHGLRRPGSSCASQSMRSSQRGKSSLIRSGGGSSRNYWDMGGSVGSGSGVVSAGLGGGGMGLWGEV